jgi:hypothetical protein
MQQNEAPQYRKISQMYKTGKANMTNSNRITKANSQNCKLNMIEHADFDLCVITQMINNF